MGEVFIYEARVLAEWIDYNGHMQDAYYGLVFSHAVDAFQDAVGFDAAYRAATGATIYLLESHGFYLSEVKEGAPLLVETRVIGADAKRFHLHQTMLSEGRLSAVYEVMELHVQTRPKPRGAEMPPEIEARLRAAALGPDETAALANRARAIGFRRRA